LRAGTGEEEIEGGASEEEQAEEELWIEIWEKCYEAKEDSEEGCKECARGELGGAKVGEEPEEQEHCGEVQGGQGGELRERWGDGVFEQCG
jgi:hypothetical protein